MRALSMKQKSKLSYLPHTSPLTYIKRHVVSLLIIAIVLNFTILFASQYFRLHQLRQTLVDINKQIEAAQNENDEIQAEIVRLQSPEYLEQMAREELGMVRSGELLFYFQD